MKKINVLVGILLLLIFSSSNVLAKATDPKLCGDISAVPATPLKEAPFQFAFDSDQPEVHLLYSPDRRYVVVMRHGACDATYMGVWDNTKKRAYGNKTVSMGYSTHGVCWDAEKPVVYFFNESEAGYPEGAGIYKWEFEKSPDGPVKLDNLVLIKKTFNKDSISAGLLDIDNKSKYLLLEVQIAYNSYDTAGKLPQEIGKLYVFDIANSKLSPCKGCSVNNWEKKHDL